MKPLMNLALVFGALLLTRASPCVAGDNTIGGTGAGAGISTGTDNTTLGTQAGESIRQKPLGAYHKLPISRRSRLGIQTRACPHP
jgi:hypothetical protein